MRLRRLELQNMRLIGEMIHEMEFSSTKNVTILLGDNGCGKTTVLDSIAFMISPFLSQFPSIPDKKLTDWDVHYDREGRWSSYLEIGADFTTPVAGFEQIPGTRTRKGRSKAPESDLKSLKQFAQFLKTQITDGAEVELPVFAYYGTGRGQINAPERKRNFQKVFERWDCYRNALTPSTDFKRFFAWFDLMEDEERRERERRRDFDYKLPALEAVRKALANFVGRKFHSPRIELHPLRFVMTEDSGICMDRNLRIEQMSDGYKIMIAMVADIAARMAEANPAMENPLLSSGIILVDEIDLHLHPRWQRVVVSQLVQTFPNVQFVLTTHSPVIIAGASGLAQILRLNREDASDEGMDIETDLTRLDIGQILLSDLFGLESLRSPIWDGKLRRRDELLGKSVPTESEKAELDALNRELSVLQNGETPAEIRASKLLAEIAKHLNIEV